MRESALAAFRVAIDEPASPHDQVVPFWEFHRDEIDSSVTRERFLPSLVLKRVGVYPQSNPESFAVLDFVVRGPSTDQILVATFDRTRALSLVSWES